MNREDIIRMAREADIEPNSYAGWLDIKELERFADLVASAEREACALLCDEYPDVGYIGENLTSDYHSYLIRTKE
jgi:hypothetical protein